MEDLIRRYQAYQEIKGLAQGTILNHVQRVGVFLAELAARGVEINKIDIETIRAIVRDRRWQAGTAATSLMIIKTFLNYLVFEGVLVKNPLAEVKMRAGQEKRYQILDDAGIEKVRATSSLLPLSGQVAINLFLDTGARNHEILAIQVKNINLEKKSIYLEKVKGGHHPRYVFFTDQTKELLKRYLPTCENGLLLPYTQNWTRSIMKKSIGIAFPTDSERLKMTPHACRHSFVTSWVKNGGNIRILKNIIGWQSMKMLDKYEHLDEDALGNGYSDYQTNRGAIVALGAK
jgi:site-specific recombinase XerD